jgi:hypothetical protein
LFPSIRDFSVLYTFTMSMAPPPAPLAAPGNRLESPPSSQEYDFSQTQKDPIKMDEEAPESMMQSSQANPRRKYCELTWSILRLPAAPADLYTFLFYFSNRGRFQPSFLFRPSSSSAYQAFLAIATYPFRFLLPAGTTWHLGYRSNRSRSCATV